MDNLNKIKKLTKKLIFTFFFLMISLGNSTVSASEQYQEVSDIESLKAAILNGENIKLMQNLELDETIKISQKSIILDLNGYTITGKDENTTGNFNLFENYKGEFTIIDSKGTGVITLKASTDRNWNAMSTIIENRAGIVNIKGGTIKHLGGSDMAYAIDVNANSFGDATLNVSGGMLYSTYTAIRLFMSTSGTTYLNITDGNIDGATSAIWAQAPESKTGQTGKITISDGNIGTINTARSEKSAVSTEVTGGELTNIKSEAGELKISGGHVSGTLTILNTNNEVVSKDEIITGGIFDKDPMNYLSSSVTISAVATKEEEKTYAVGENAVQNIVSEAEKGSSIVVSGNVNLTNVQSGVTIKATENSTVIANGTTVTEEGIVIKDNSNVSSKDTNSAKTCPNDNKINIQECIEKGQSEEVCIEKLCPGGENTENPKTGSYLPLFSLLVMSIIISFLFVTTSRKNYFIKMK